MQDTMTLPRAGRREWIGLAVLILPLLLVSTDVSVLYFTVPFISRELAPSSTEQLWIFDIYGFVLAGFLITMGALGDRMGRRRLLMIGALGFSVASALAAYSSSASMLISARAVLGVAGATLMPSTLALVRNMFYDEKQRSTAIAVWTAAMTFGIALGPIVSGLLLEHFWWGSVFLINVPAMVLLLVLAPVLLPEYRNSGRGRFDLGSAMLSIAAVLPVIWGVKEIAAHGADVTRAGVIVAGLVIAVVFLRRQRRRPDPMLDLAVLRRPAFAGSVVVSLLATFAMIGFAVLSTQYLQLVLGMSPLKGALWSLVPSAGVGAAAPIASTLARRGVDRAKIIAAGFLVAAGGFAVLSAVAVDSGLRVWLVGSALYVAGVVVVLSTATELAVGTVPPERAGASSALMETATEFGNALGIAILGSVATAVYRAQLGDHIPGIARGNPRRSRRHRGTLAAGRGFGPVAVCTGGIRGRHAHRCLGKRGNHAAGRCCGAGLLARSGDCPPGSGTRTSRRGITSHDIAGTAGGRPAGPPRSTPPHVHEKSSQRYVVHPGLSAG